MTKVVKESEVLNVEQALQRARIQGAADRVIELFDQDDDLRAVVNGLIQTMLNRKGPIREADEDFDDEEYYSSRTAIQVLILNTAASRMFFPAPAREYDWEV